MPSPTGWTAITAVDFGAIPDRAIFGLLVDSKWGGALGTGVTLTYSFPGAGSTWAASDYSNTPGLDEPFTNFSQLTASQQAAVTTALQAWSHVANISFVLVADTASEVGDIRIANTGGGAMDPGTYAYAFAPFDNDRPNGLGAAYQGDVWINYQQPVSTGNEYAVGYNGYNTILHELGHAIGLDHPFSIAEFNSGGSLDQYDTFQYTTMSYSPIMGLDDDGYSFSYPSTPMLLDIQALQYLYGPNTTWHSEDNLYSYNEVAHYYETIYDTGGNDTIQYNSGNDGAVIDLRGGYNFSQLGLHNTISYDGDIIAEALNHNNVTIYFNQVIENAIGGSGADSIIGNDAANSLSGGSGADTMTGGIGNDSLFGQGSNDVMDGGGGSDYMIGGGQADSMSGGDAADHIEGQLGADTVLGGPGGDWVHSGQGNDSIVGNLGADTLDGGLGGDTIQGSSGTDLVLGAPGNDWLEGNLGADTIVGGVGNDTMAGGSGIDIFRYDATSLNSADFAANTQDVITGGAGDLISMAGLLNLLEIGNTALSGLGSDTLLGTSFVIGQTNVLFTGAGGFLQFDLNGDGSFLALNDFQISLAGVSSVTFFSGDDFFHLA